MLKKLLYSCLMLASTQAIVPMLAVAATDKPKSEQIGNAEKALVFVENKGQITTKNGRLNASVLYKVSNKGSALYLRPNGMTYLLTQNLSNRLHEKHDKIEKSTPIAYHRISMRLQGANKNCVIKEELPTERYENYYIGKKSVSDVHGYHKLTYTNIYPNIDWVVYSKDNSVKYDFVVHPGGNPGQIKMIYSDQSALKLNSDNGFSLQSPLGEIVEQKPYSYQAGEEIASAFTLKKNCLSFSLGHYDNQKDLVIDPGISWSTYLGGTGGESAFDTKVDKTGNVYMVGGTTSIDFLMDTSYYAAFDTASGNVDCFISKFDGNGQLLWASYYGGIEAEAANCVTITPDNKAVIFGSTWSSDLYMVNGFQPIQNGYTDAFLVKFGTSGTVERSSYFGSNQAEPAFSITCDYSGNLYFVGSTDSPGGIAFGGGNPTYSGGWDGYVVKIDSSWVPQWGAYFGGSSNDEIYGITVEPDSGFVFTTGYTTSTNGIDYNSVTPSTYGGGDDAFLAKHDFNGNLLSSRYFGGAGNDVGNDIDCEPNFLHLVSIVGTTNSSSGIANSNQQALAGGTDAFLGDFRYDNTLISSTYVGGSGNDKGNDIVDYQGGLYICGLTESTNNIANANSFQPLIGQGQDGFIAGFAWFGMGPVYSTYFGGGGPDQLFGIDQYASHLVVAGESASYSNMCFINSYQSTNYNPNGWTNILGKFPLDCPNSPNPISISTNNGTNAFCFGTNLTLNATGANGLTWTNGPSGNSYSVSNGGTYEVSGTKYGCTFYQQITVAANPVPAVSISPSGAQYICEHDSMLLTANSSSAVAYQWYLDALPLSGQTTASIYAKSQGVYTVEAFNLFDCSKISFPVQLFVNSAPPAIITASGSTAICTGSTVQLVANNAAVSYQWLLNGNPITGATSNTYFAGAAGNYSVREVSPNTCDSISNELNVTVHPYPSASITYAGIPYTCLGNSVTLNAVTDIGTTYQWQLNSGNLTGETANSYIANGGGNYSVVVTGPGNCATTSSGLEINPQPIPSNICFATIDTAFGKTAVKLAWQKPAQSYVKGFVIHREFAGLGFVPIDTVSNSLYSAFIDTSASPETSVEAYKVCTLDSCGAMSDLSLAITHKTMLLQGALDFGQTYIGWDWEPYVGVNDPTRFYRIMRDKNGNGQWDSIGATPWSVTAWNDTAVNYPNARYSVDLVWQGNCTPSQRVMAGFNTTRSNIKNRISIQVGFKPINASEVIRLYPNPAKNEISISGIAPGWVQTEIMDLTGRMVQRRNIDNKADVIQLSLSDLAAGIYSLRIITKGTSHSEKLVIEN